MFILQLAVYRTQLDQKIPEHSQFSADKKYVKSTVTFVKYNPQTVSERHIQSTDERT
jgi:hypothetical protein